MILRHLLNIDVLSAHETLLTGELGGGAPVRVWQGVGQSSRWGRPGEGAGGGTPPAQLGGVGKRCKLPTGVWGGAREANAFFCVENPQKYVKAALKM